MEGAGGHLRLHKYFRKRAYPDLDLQISVYFLDLPKKKTYRLPPVVNKEKREAWIRIRI